MTKIRLIIKKMVLGLDFFFILFIILITKQLLHFLLNALKEDMDTLIRSHFKVIKRIKRREEMEYYRESNGKGLWYYWKNWKAMPIEVAIKLVLDIIIILTLR